MPRARAAAPLTDQCGCRSHSFLDPSGQGILAGSIFLTLGVYAACRAHPLPDGGYCPSTALWLRAGHTPRRYTQSNKGLWGKGLGADGTRIGGTPGRSMKRAPGVIIFRHWFLAVPTLSDGWSAPTFFKTGGGPHSGPRWVRLPSTPASA